MTILIFELSIQSFALRLEAVREVVRAVTITPLAGAADLVEGVIDLRGALVPVMDVRKRLGLAVKAVEASDHLIIAEAGGRTVALRVDAVKWLRDVDHGSLERTRGLTSSAEFILGVAKLPDGLVVIQDLERFLSPEEARVLEDALAAASAPEGWA